MGSQLYGGRDPRSVPAYSVGTAAYLLGLPESTLRSWVGGPTSESKTDGDSALPLIVRPNDSGQLSFMNLIEAHVLAALRGRYNVPLSSVRRALDYLRVRQPRALHPLLEQEFQTDGVHLFIDAFGALVNISRGGQLALRDLIEAHLERVERDDRGLPARLFPFVRHPDSDPHKLAAQPRVVMIDPRISFGKSVITGTGIPTAAVAERYKAGESMADLAEDFDRNCSEIEEAIRYELRLHAA